MVKKFRRLSLIDQMMVIGCLVGMMIYLTILFSSGFDNLIYKAFDEARPAFLVHP